MDDVFVYIDIEVDTKKHVKPVEVKQPKTIDEIELDNYKTVTKYTFYESGKRWVKVLLEFNNIKEHPKDKIQIEFKQRSFFLKVHDY